MQQFWSAIVFLQSSLRNEDHWEAAARITGAMPAGEMTVENMWRIRPVIEGLHREIEGAPAPLYPPAACSIVRTLVRFYSRMEHHGSFPAGTPVMFTTDWYQRRDSYPRAPIMITSRGTILDGIPDLRGSGEVRYEVRFEEDLYLGEEWCPQGHIEASAITRLLPEG